MIAAIAEVLAVVRRVIGAPDYAAYLQHLRERHPETVPLTEAEFIEERMAARYSSPGSRCC
jgi:uncharacterized short protein YbdD (DUF466 family)